MTLLIFFSFFFFAVKVLWRLTQKVFRAKHLRKTMRGLHLKEELGIIHGVGGLTCFHQWRQTSVVLDVGTIKRKVFLETNGFTKFNY